MHKNIRTLLLPTLALRALLVVCALAVVSQLYLPLPILPQVAHDYGLTPSAAPDVMTAFGFAYATGFLIFGPLSDRLSCRRVMLWGLAALAVVTAALAVAGSAPLLLAGRALQGLAAAAFPPAAIAYLAERGTVPQRTWGVAWLSTAFLSAGLLGQLYGGTVGGRWGLGVALLPLAAIYACTAWALHATPAEAAPTPAQPWLTRYSPLGSLLADARLRRVYGPALLLLMCFVAFYLLLDAQAQATLMAHGITPLAARGVALPAFLAPLAVAVVMPRHGAERLAMAGLGIAATGLALCAWAGVEHPYSLLAASVVFVAGVGVSVPSLIAQVTRIAAAEVRGLAVALYTFVLFVGASLGPALAHYTTQRQWPLSLALCLLAALLVTAALYAFTGRHRAGLPAQQQQA